jgi:general L-amino acid transport system permease protein
MSDPGLLRSALAPSRPAPVVTTGPYGWARTRLFNTPGNAVLTLLCVLAAAAALLPSLRFLLLDAVWSGSSREACLAPAPDAPVGACWPFISAKLTQLIYGFYPEPQRWRVNLTFVLAAVLLLPLLVPRWPGKAVNAALFFVAFPVVAFFLLHGGGLHRFALTALADGLSAMASDLGALAHAAPTRVSGRAFLLAPLLEAALQVAASAVAVLAGWMQGVTALLQRSGQPFWSDYGATAVLVTALVLVALGPRRGLRAGLATLGGFAVMALAFAALDLPHGGLPVVETRQWGGLLVTLVVSVTGIVASMPIGIALALGRRSGLPLLRICSIAFIEFWRGVPLITVLFFATYMLPLFLPGNFSVDGLLRVLVGVAVFAGAYNAEVIRGGLQALPPGQTEAAQALGLSAWKITALITLPQALRHVIPGLVNSFIALFKDTTLVLIVAIFDLLGSLRAAFADPNWATPSTLFTGFAFTGMIYFAFCFAMSRYALFVERRLNRHRHRHS